MFIFTSLIQAQREGFQWLEYLPELGLHLVQKSFTRSDGLRQRGLALARSQEQR